MTKMLRPAKAHRDYQHAFVGSDDTFHGAPARCSRYLDVVADCDGHARAR